MAALRWRALRLRDPFPLQQRVIVWVSVWWASVVRRPTVPSFATTNENPAAPPSVPALLSSRQSRHHGVGWYAVMGLAGTVIGTVLSPWSRGVRGDTLWHLAAGQWIVRHGALPRTDPFSWLAGSTPWINIEWGWDALTGLLIRWWGTPGLAMWAVVMVGGILAAQWVRFRHWGTVPTRAGDLMALSMIGLGLFWTWRPQLVSYAAIVAWWAVLEQAYEHPQRLWWLVPFLAVWEQLHGGYLLGLVSLLWWIGDRMWRGSAHPLDRRAWRTLGPVLAALGIVLELTPWGYGSVAHALWESHQPSLWQWIVEWQSPNFHQPISLMLIGVPVLVFGAWAYAHPERLRRAPRWLWGLFALTLGMTLLAVRNEPFYVLALATLVGALAPGATPTPRAPWGVWGISALMLCGLLAAQVPRWTTVHRGLSPAIVHAIQAHPGHVLNSYRAGDSLIAWHIPDSLDGRTDLWMARGVFPSEVLMEAGDWSWPRLTAQLHAWHVRWILWRRQSAGAYEITGRPGIRVAAQTSTWTLFRVAYGPGS